MPDAELKRFKTAINLTEFAASRGYVLDSRESSRNSAVMRHPDGDKVVIARNGATGDWVYFSVRDDRDSGSVIDFLQKRDGGSLGRIRQELRTWIGSPRQAVPASAYLWDLLPVTRDRASVLMGWERARPCFDLPYLTGRGIGPATLMLQRFAGCIRVDARHNALFPHYDRAGLCGFEIKNKNFTGFAAGGVKGLWCSAVKSTDQNLVLVESAIDAYSYQILHCGDGARYMSTGGSLNQQQPEWLRGAMEKMPAGAIVILAFDRDEGGEMLAEGVRRVAPEGRQLRRALPDLGTGKDWNEMLQHRLGLD